MSTLYTHCLHVTTRDGKLPSAATEGELVERFPEFVRDYAPQGCDIFYHRKIANQIYWIAACGMARIGLAPSEEFTRVVIGPQLGVGATLDFTSMYQSFCGGFNTTSPSFALSPDDLAMHNSIEACIENYERDVQALLRVVLNAIFDLKLRTAPSGERFFTPQQVAQRHMPTLYMQLKSTCTSCLSLNLNVEELLAHCKEAPDSFTITPPWGDLSFADASIRKRLTRRGYDRQEKGDFSIYLKDGELPVISTCISRNTSANLEMHRTALISIPSIMKGSLPAWMSFESDPDELLHILQAVGTLPSYCDRAPTGVAMELAYPHYCRTLYVTFDDDPTSEVSCYQRIPLTKPLVGDVFTLSMLMNEEPMKTGA